MSEIYTTSRPDLNKNLSTSLGEFQCSAQRYGRQFLDSTSCDRGGVASDQNFEREGN